MHPQDELFITSMKGNRKEQISLLRFLQKFYLANIQITHLNVGNDIIFYIFSFKMNGKHISSRFYVFIYFCRLQYFPLHMRMSVRGSEKEVKIQPFARKKRSKKKMSRSIFIWGHGNDSHAQTYKQQNHVYAQCWWCIYSVSLQTNQITQNLIWYMCLLCLHAIASLKLNQITQIQFQTILN